MGQVLPFPTWPINIPSRRCCTLIRQKVSWKFVIGSWLNSSVSIHGKFIQCSTHRSNDVASDMLNWQLMHRIMGIHLKCEQKPLRAAARISVHALNDPVALPTTHIDPSFVCIVHNQAVVNNSPFHLVPGAAFYLISESGWKIKFVHLRSEWLIECNLNK